MCVTNEKMQIGSTGNSVENLGYKARIPNVPYQFADFDVNFYWRDLWKKGNMLSVTYDNQYMHSFSYYSQAIGSKNKDFMVPDQFSHNLTLSYSLKNGRYNISFECLQLHERGFVRQLQPSESRACVLWQDTCTFW